MNTPTKRTAIYVDGFNLYYGILKENPAWKWLNLEKFFQTILPDDKITSIKYFTANVHPDRTPSAQRDRQDKYLKALRTLPKVSLIFGKYQNREVKCEADCRKDYKVAEEKKTDVNIAVNMIHDAIHGHAEKMLLVSGDSDLEPAVKWIREYHSNIHINVAIPVLNTASNSRNNHNYRRMKVNCAPLSIDKIHHCQFEETLALNGDKSVTRPSEWY